MMKLKLLSFSFLALGVFCPIVSTMTQPAGAVCVAVDVNNQIALRGSPTPSKQENNVAATATGDCFGNVSYSGTTSVAGGSELINQTRNSTHLLTGAAENSYGLTGEMIFVPVNNQVDVYVPAYDPEFMQKVGAYAIPENFNY